MTAKSVPLQADHSKWRMFDKTYEKTAREQGRKEERGSVQRGRYTGQSRQHRRQEERGSGKEAGRGTEKGKGEEGEQGEVREGLQEGAEA